MNIVTSKIPGERAKQYAAWLLYCEVGSLEKTLRMWERISAQDDTEMIPFFGVFLGKPAGLATLKRWSVKYRWQERTELKNTEDLEDMRFKFKRIKQTRAYKIVQALYNDEDSPWKGQIKMLGVGAGLITQANYFSKLLPLVSRQLRQQHLLTLLHFYLALCNCMSSLSATQKFIK